MGPPLHLFWCKIKDGSSPIIGYLLLVRGATKVREHCLWRVIMFHKDIVRLYITMPNAFTMKKGDGIQKL